MNAATDMSDEEIEILRDAARTFRVKQLPIWLTKPGRLFLGSWPRDAEAARIKDPPLNTGNLGNSTTQLCLKRY
jgi:hypothetical protein